MSKNGDRIKKTCACSNGNANINSELFRNVNIKSKLLNIRSFWWYIFVYSVRNVAYYNYTWWRVLYSRAEIMFCTSETGIFKVSTADNQYVLYVLRHSFIFRCWIITVLKLYAFMMNSVECRGSVPECPFVLLMF